MYMGSPYPVQHQQTNMTHMPNMTHRSTTPPPPQQVQAAQLIGMNVRINRGGPDSVSGRLISVQNDFLVLSTPTGIVYVNGTHVKSITQGSSSGGRSGGRSGGSGGRSGGRSGGSMGHTSRPPFIHASSFNALLHRMNHQFIQVNQGGPEKLDGFLAEINNDQILLIVGREFVRVPIFHIKTVSLSGKSNGNKSNKNNNNNNNNNKSNKNSSGKSGSGGNRQSGRTSNSGRNRG